MYCDVETSQVICLADQPSIYRVPLVLRKQGLIEYFLKKFSLKMNNLPVNNRWALLSKLHDSMFKTVSIALVGKYTKLKDSYASVIKSLNHASMAINYRLKILYIEATNLELEAKLNNPNDYYEAWHNLARSDGILVPGGFGARGLEGKILAIEYARINRKPFLGICFGFQCAVIEYCRNVLAMKNAHSQEQNSDQNEMVIIEMPEHNPGVLGGTMRVGSRETIFVCQNCITYQLYKPEGNRIFERHRHRYEVNVNLIDEIEKFDLKFVAKDNTGQRMEIMELASHPYFVGVQFHPEYTSRPFKPSPPYLGLLLAATNNLQLYLNNNYSLYVN